MIDTGRTEYKTWTDFNQRMQRTTVSQADWELFYNRYHGFIVEICIKKGWKNLTQDIVDRCVLKFNDASIKKIRHDHPGSLRAWMYKEIHGAYVDIIRSRKREKNSIINDARVIESDGTVPKRHGEEKEKTVVLYDTKTLAPDAFHGIDPIENHANDLGWCDDDLWRSYVLYLAFDIIKKNTSRRQYQAFVWRKCKKRKIEEIAQTIGCTKEQVYEYSRAVADKIKNQIRKLGEMFPAQSQEDWAALLQQAQEGYKHYREIADEFSTRCER